MNKLSVNLENCYGIKKLEYIFSFEDNNPFSIYAPNGFMKTSFAKTFSDVQSNSESKDIIFPDRATIRVIEDELNENIHENNIFVIEPYNADFNYDKTTLLLVNKTLKDKYDIAVKNIEDKEVVINKKLKQLSGLTGRSLTPVDEIKDIFSLKDSDIYSFYENINTKTTDDRFAHISYAEVFNEKTLKILSSGTIKSDLKEYIEKYNELVQKSPILSQKFNHYSANSITKSLSDNNFFEAKHTVNLKNGDEQIEISTSAELTDRFTEEKTKILNDKVLLKKFDSIDKKLSNAQLRKFRDYLFDNKDILPELTDYKKFQKDIWLSYFHSIKELISDFVKVYQGSKKLIETVIQTAKKEETQWKEVVEIFNSRFSVPFVLKVTNQEDVILKGDSPRISFEFKDGTSSSYVNKTTLLQALSQGEKRALYILNLLFEIDVRKRQNIETILIVDDIADSFDYKNKFAIIEYLKEISSITYFHIIFLTHNFDFHRTVSSRISIPREKRLFVEKNDIGITLTKEKYQKNPFTTWKKDLETNPQCLLATIPFVRNLAEYCGNDNDFLKLTSLLHIKNDTSSITINDLETIYKNILRDKSTLCLPDRDKSVLELIKEVALEIITENSESVELEHKVILSIAIRLYAEEFMIFKINDPVFVNSITSCQTFKLFKRYSNEYHMELDSIAILEQVNLMTPENIHLNSFMYEPILDMGAIHLYELHNKVTQLTT